MYKLQDAPGDEFVSFSGSICRPVASLKDEWGGVLHIVKDDNCYVCFLKHQDKAVVNYDQGSVCYYKPTIYIFPEVFEVLKGLPNPSSGSYLEF